MTKWEDYENRKSVKDIECQQQKYIHPQLYFETVIYDVRLRDIQLQINCKQQPHNLNTINLKNIKMY